MNVEVRTGDPLLGGFYTVSEAARLLQIENRQRITMWLQGRKDGTSLPIIARDYKPVNNIQELSFWDLIEVRFIHHFRRQGLSLQYLRKVWGKARQELGSQHPFALSNFKFMTERKRIFQHAIEEDGDSKTWEILGDQLEMYEVIENILAQGLTFDPKSHLANMWKPIDNKCPSVIVDPRYAFGHPVITERHIPTSAIYKTWRAEGFNAERVADWFQIAIGEVDAAVEFEARLAG